MNDVTFSVVIPAYNRAESTAAAVRSILRFTGNNVEIIVVNDGSTDDTLARVSAIEDARLTVIDQQNKERGAARNAGTLAASGQYITFLDSDDLLEPNFFREATAFIETRPDCNCFFMHYTVRTNGQDTLPDYPQSNFVGEELMGGNFLSCLGVVLKRSIAQENLFLEDRRMSTLEDWELWLRIAARYGFGQHPKQVAVLMNHDDRSVRLDNAEALEKKFSLFMDTVLSNELIRKKFARSVHRFKASCYSYISLHLALGKGKRTTVISYWWKAFTHAPLAVFSRRTLAIIKHML